MVFTKFSFLGLFFFFSLQLSLHASQVGQVKTYTHLNKVVDLVSNGNNLYIATTGGLRILEGSSKQEMIYNEPARGLVDVSVSALVNQDNFTWALSEQGYIYKFKGTSLLKTIDRGLVSLRWRINPRSVISKDKFLIIGTQKGLVFFDTQKEKIAFSLDRIADQPNPSIFAIGANDSTLVVSTGTRVYLTQPFWKDPLSPSQDHLTQKGDIFSSWKPLTPLLTTPTDTVRQLTFFNNNWYGALGFQNLSGPPSIQAKPGEPLVIGGVEFPLYKSVRAVSIHQGQAYFINNTSLFTIENSVPTPRNSPLSLGPGTLTNVSMSPLGPVLLTNSEPGSVVYSLYRLDGSTFKQLENSLVLHGPEADKLGLQILAFAPSNRPLITSWGEGYRFIDSPQPQVYNNSNSCLKSHPGLATFPVLTHAAPYKTEGLFSAQFGQDLAYALTYLDYERQQVTCFASQGPLNGIALDLKVIQDSILLVAFNNGIDAYIIKNPRSEFGLEKIGPTLVLPAGTFDALATEMDAQGRLWASTEGSLWVAENFNKILSYEKRQDPKQLENFKQEIGFSDTLVALTLPKAQGCNYSLIDSLKHLWFSCQNGLFEILPGKTTPVQTYNQYTQSDGLLSDQLGSLAYDASEGRIWVASSKGLNSLQTGSRVLSASQTSNLKVYPNPFRIIHDKVIFENLLPNSRISIFSEGGILIKQSKSSEIMGWQWFWDGTDQRRNKVSPGIYYYAVQTGNKAHKGHIIVAR